MRNRIGIMLDNIGPSQLGFYTLIQVNNVFHKDPKNDLTIFIQNISSPLIRPMCSVMNMSEVMSFDGDIVATSFEMADKLTKTINNGKKHFHVWSLDWVYNPYPFEQYVNILNNPELNLSTRSLYYANAIEKYCGRKVEVITPNFNIKKIINGQQ